jgi:hypothetical protein
MKGNVLACTTAHAARRALSMRMVNEFSGNGK